MSELIEENTQCEHIECVQAEKEEEHSRRTKIIINDYNDDYSFVVSHNKNKNYYVLEFSERYHYKKPTFISLKFNEIKFCELNEEIITIKYTYGGCDSTIKLSIHDHHLFEKISNLLLLDDGVIDELINGRLSRKVQTQKSSECMQFEQAKFNSNLIFSETIPDCFPPRISKLVNLETLPLHM